MASKILLAIPKLYMGWRRVTQSYHHVTTCL